MHAGREAIALMATGVALIFLATAFFFIRNNADLGKDIINNSIEKTESASNQVISESFSKIISNPTTMPASAAYTLIYYNESHIKSITCKICNPNGGDTYNVIDDACFNYHITGDVKIWAEKDPTDNQYRIYLSSMINIVNGIGNKKIVSPSEVKNLLTVYKSKITNVHCAKCGNNQSDIEHCCFFKGNHSKEKKLSVYTTYDPSSKTYQVYISE